MRRLVRVGSYAVMLGLVLALFSPVVPPREFWPVSFFALAFPALFVGNLLLAGYWAWQKDWLLASHLGVSLLCLSAFLDLYPVANAAPSPAPEAALNFVSFNTFGGYGLHDSTLARVHKRNARMVACLDADVVALQESPKYRPIHKAYLAAMDSLGLTHHYFPEQTSISLHSRFPMQGGRVVSAPNKTNGVITATLHPPGQHVVQLIAAHLQSNKVRLDAREVAWDAATANSRAYWTLRGVAANYRRAARLRAEQAGIVVDLVAQRSHPVVLLGDLNDVPLSYTAGELRRAGLEDSFSKVGHGSGVSYPGSIPGLRIDYVMHTPELTAHTAEVLDCPFSDHYPVSALLSLPANP